MLSQRPRVLLKLSGEALKIGPSDPDGKSSHLPYSREAFVYIGKEIKAAMKYCELAILTGGGNLGRGSEHINTFDMTPSVAHNWGMQATVLNMAALTDALEKLGIKTRPMIDQKFHVPALGESFIYRKAIHHLEEGRVIVLGGGAGMPGVTTDTGAVLRAVEIGATIILKGTKVNGVFTDDPKKDPDAKFLPRLTYQECLVNRKIRIIDKAAVALAEEHRLPILIFNVFEPGNLKKILTGKNVGSLITS